MKRESLLKYLAVSVMTFMLTACDGKIAEHPEIDKHDPRVYYVEQESLDDWFSCYYLYYQYPIGNDFASALDSLKREVIPMIEQDIQKPDGRLYNSIYHGERLDTVTVYDWKHRLIENKTFIAVGFVGDSYVGQTWSGDSIYLPDYPMADSYVIDSEGGLYYMALPPD